MTIHCPRRKKRKNAKAISVLLACLKASKTRLMTTACTAAKDKERKAMNLGETLRRSVLALRKRSLTVMVKATGRVVMEHGSLWCSV